MKSAIGILRYGVSSAALGLIFFSTSSVKAGAQGFSPDLGCIENPAAVFQCSGNHEISEAYAAIADDTFRVRAVGDLSSLAVNFLDGYSLSGQFDLADRDLSNSYNIGFLNISALSGVTSFYQGTGSTLTSNVTALRLGSTATSGSPGATSGDIHAIINGAVIADNDSLSIDGMLLAGSGDLNIFIGRGGNVSGSGNGLVAFNTGAAARISVQNSGRIESFGTQQTGGGSIPRTEHAALIIVNQGAGVSEITTTGEIVGGSYGVAVAHMQTDSSFRINVGGEITGRGGVAIGLGGTSFPFLGNNLRQATVVLLPGWQTIGDTDASGVYDPNSVNSHARLVFGGTAAENIVRGLPVFDLTDWDDGSENAHQIPPGAPETETENRFFGFQPVLRKIGTSAFELTDDGLVSNLDEDGLPGPAFTEAVIEEGTLILNAAAITMALREPAQLVPGAGEPLPDLPLFEPLPVMDEQRATLEIHHDATLGVIGTSQVSGSVRNLGTMDLSTFDNSTMTRLTITGNYGANSNVVLDVELGSDGSPSDVLVINGDTAGTTHVTVVNAGGSGASTTGNGILIIDTDPSQNLEGTFVLARPVIAGAYQYGLFDGPLTASAAAGGNWYLRTIGLQPGAPIYEVLPTVLLNTQQVGTLAQRIEGRQMLTGSSDSQTSLGVWLRVESERLETTPAATTSGTTYAQHIWRLQAGADAMVHDSESGSLVVGLNAFRGTSSAEVAGAVGNGSIRTETRGLGMTATWYGSHGFYTDAQLQYTVFDSDLSSQALGALASNLSGEGYTASIEFGQEITFPSGITFTPQAQIMWSEVAFDTFTGPNSERVSIGGDDRLQLRLGVAAESTWNFGSVDEARLYGIGNAIRELRDVTSVSVSGTDLLTYAPDWVGQIGFGGSYDRLRANGAMTSIYGEVTTSRELSRGKVRGLAGTIGVRVEF